MESKVKELITELLESKDYILSNVVYENENGTNFLRVFIDKKDEYININDCVIVNDLIGPVLEDLIDESYILDVCSTEKGCE